MAGSAPSTGEPGDDGVTATDGRVIGQRAIQTRRRILDATADLLKAQGALDVKVIDVAREVGTSPATFYQYFGDVEEAILALAREMVDRAATLSVQLDCDWTGPDGLDRARGLVADHMRFWDENGAVLRIMHLRADEREPRFRQVRVEYNASFMRVMGAKARKAKVDGRMPSAMDAWATAGAMLAVLDRLPSYRETFKRRGTDRQAMVETVARILHTGLTGQSAP